MDTKLINTSSNLTLNSRKSLTLTGVKDIGKFDDHNVTVFTNQGELAISGNNIKIGKLCTESGQLELRGKIDSMSYSNSKSCKSFFKKLFK